MLLPPGHPLRHANVTIESSITKSTGKNVTCAESQIREEEHSLTHSRCMDRAQQAAASYKLLNAEFKSILGRGVQEMRELNPLVEWEQI